MKKTERMDKMAGWGYKSDSEESPEYRPTRFEYIAIAALQGLIVGRSVKDQPKAVQQAIRIATDMEIALDSSEAD